jgi:hypothetical protein
VAAAAVTGGDAVDAIESAVVVEAVATIVAATEGTAVGNAVAVATAVFAVTKVDDTAGDNAVDMEDTCDTDDTTGDNTVDIEETSDTGIVIDDSISSSFDCAVVIKDVDVHAVAFDHIAHAFDADVKSHKDETDQIILELSEKVIRSCSRAAS